MSEVKVNKVSPRSGTTVTIGDSGDTINIVGTLQNNGSALTGDISSVVAGTGLSGGATSGVATLNIEAAQPTITSLGTITGFTSTGIDDNADATAITIDSSENVGIKNTTPSNFNASARQLVVGSGSGDNGITIFAGTSNNSSLFLADGTVGTNGYRGSINYLHNGDALTLHANATETMRLTNGKVGIGTSSPRAKLDLGAGSGDSSTISTTASDYQLILEAPQGTGDYGRNIGWCVGTGTVNASINAVDTGSSDKTGLAFVTGDSSGVAEAVRIDANGRLLVGKTTPDNNSVGFEALSTGFGSFTRDGGQALLLNRKSSDGEILSIRKDGTTVGDISSNSGSIELNSQGSSLKFSHLGTNVAFLTANNFAPNADNAMDLGYDAGRFNDLYLGGGLYVGGTGTANKLDDYEEGTFTPTITNQAGTSIYSGSSHGAYTKIGNSVRISIRFPSDATLSGTTTYPEIRGLPFTISNSADAECAFSLWCYSGFSITGVLQIRAMTGNSKLIIQGFNNGSGFNISNSNFSGNLNLDVGGIYETDS